MCTACEFNACCEQEVTSKEHNRTDILAKLVKRKPTKTVPKALPEVIIEQTPALPGANLPLLGDNTK